MLDGLATRSGMAVRHQRMRGEAAVVIGHRRGASRLVDLHQSGSAKAMLPRVEGEAPEVIFLNTAGGVTGGDRLSYALIAGRGTQAVGSTQTAERAYASLGEPGTVDIRLEVGENASLAWLPQETILFENSWLRRRSRVDLAPTARYLGVETLVLGRAAMGENPHRLRLDDRREIWRSGRPVLIEPLRLGAEAMARRDGTALFGSARAVSTIVLVAPEAAEKLGRVQALLDDAEVRAAASAWDGRLVMRALAEDGWPLRRLVARVLIALHGAALPRVWQI